MAVIVEYIKKSEVGGKAFNEKEKIRQMGPDELSKGMQIREPFNLPRTRYFFINRQQFLCFTHSN